MECFCSYFYDECQTNIFFGDYQCGRFIEKYARRVYVTARGEIANTIYIQRIEPTIDNASGYYVSMQEDGLPLMNVNYGTR
jgi:hypothetical protein